MPLFYFMQVLGKEKHPKMPGAGVREFMPHLRRGLSTLSCDKLLKEVLRSQKH